MGQRSAKNVPTPRVIARKRPEDVSPPIAFQSAGATAEPIGPDIYQVQIAGELRLHGVRNELTIPAQVIVRANELRVRGACKLRQSDYGITPISFANGTVGVADEVTLRFDLVAPLSSEQRRTSLNL